MCGFAGWFRGLSILTNRAGGSSLKPMLFVRELSTIWLDGTLASPATNAKQMPFPPIYREFVNLNGE